MSFSQIKGALTLNPFNCAHDLLTSHLNISSTDKWDFKKQISGFQATYFHYICSLFTKIYKIRGNVCFQQFKPHLVSVFVATAQ